MMNTLTGPATELVPIAIGGDDAIHVGGSCVTQYVMRNWTFPRAR